MRLGKNMKHALNFAKRYPKWHSYAEYCRPTIDALNKLEKLGLIEINSFRQFRII